MTGRTTRAMSAPATTPVTTRGREAADAADAGNGTRTRDLGNDDDAEVPEHLCCCVCLDAPPSHVFQCRNGHLLCGGSSGSSGSSDSSGSSGCLGQLRARARRAQHPPTCPMCRVGGGGAVRVQVQFSSP